MDAVKGAGITQKYLNFIKFDCSQSVQHADSYWSLNIPSRSSFGFAFSVFIFDIRTFFMCVVSLFWFRHSNLRSALDVPDNLSTKYKKFYELIRRYNAL